MIDKTSKLFRLLLLCLLMSTFSVAHAKEVYGFMTGNGSDGEVPIGMYKFDTDALQPQLLSSLMYSFWGGAYVGDKYLMILSDDATGYLTEGLCAYDLESNALQLRYAQQPYQCSDLTYDYSTATLYGVMVKNTGEEVTPRLIKIDTQTGSYTKVATLDKKIVAIASTYFGDLYAMSAEGSLYEMNKSTGELTLLGSTGLKTSTSEAQSMEFDRATGELYWAGLDENNYTFFCQIDPTNGAIIKRNQLDNNSLIVGLHIPFVVAEAAAPAKPQNLQATMGDQGTTLTWTNPTTTYDGQSLQAITKVEVWRNNTLIKTFDQAEVGQAMTYTDADADVNGHVRYIVYAYNETGKGEGASVKVMLGEDVPNVVTALTAQKQGDNVLLTWSAPTNGKNGGNITPDHLTYNVTRQPDGKVFADLKTTQFTDDLSSQQACYYTWQVTCKNDVGESDAVQTSPLVAGQSIVPPYTLDFEGTLWRNQWLVVDHNADGNTWSTQGDFFVYNTSYTNAADDSLVSVPFHLQANTPYIIRYDILAPNFFSAEHFRLSLKGNTGEQVLEDLDQFTTSDYSTPESRNVPFEVTEEGDYQLCMAALSDAGQFMIKISAFSVEAELETDLAVTDLTTEGQLRQGEAATFKVNVKNVGSEAASSYLVKLLDANNQVLASKTVDETLDNNSSKVVTLSYTPSTLGLLTLKATVSATDDNNAVNDTVTSQFNVLGADESIVEMGGTDYYTDFPFWFSGYQYNYAQALYLKDEVGGEAGEILQLQYDYVNNGKALTDKAIKIYMANTDQRDVTSGWIAQDDMTLVLDTAVTFLAGEHTLTLPLHTPFVYTGSNLCIMTQKIDNEQTDDVYFFATATDDPRTALYNGDEAEVVLSSVMASARLNQVRLIKNTHVPASIHHAVGAANGLKLLVAPTRVSVEGETAVRFTLTDLCGKTIQRLPHAHSISLEGLAPGLYLVTATLKGEQTVVKVVVRP